MVHVDCAYTAAPMLVVGKLVHTLRLWEEGSKVSKEWVQDNHDHCMGNSVLGLTVSAVVYRIKVEGGSHKAQVTYLDSRFWVPISIALEFSSPSCVPCSMLLVMVEEMSWKHNSICRCTSAPISCDDAWTSNYVPDSSRTSCSRCTFALSPGICSWAPVVSPACTKGGSGTGNRGFTDSG